MNPVKAFATTCFATAMTIAVGLATSGSAEAASYRTGNGKIAGFQVNYIDRASVDTIYVPLPNGYGRVDIHCESGDYKWNSLLGKTSARSIAGAWCGFI